MSDNQGRYIAMISLHGLVRGTDMELGRDADTGGQVKYVVELARALVEHSQVDRVDLFTRLVVDPKVDSSYAEPTEELAPGANIVRIQSGPRRYLRKEVLWPYMEAFADNMVKYFRAIGRGPDLIHGHYADAGYVASCLGNVLDTPVAFTGHSLGRVKRQRLLDQGLEPDTIEKRYNITRRIEAEETALDNAAFVIASTNQETTQQYELYDQYEPGRMIVNPPGVALERFQPPSRLSREQPPIYGEVFRFLGSPKKPMILAISRADARKNIATLIHAYGQNPRLREIANLVLVLGNRDDIQTMDKGAREVLADMLLLVDRYDLYGSIAYPKHHEPDDVPDLYRLAARTRGVFVNPALTEPFGLTLIEAAASGLPVVATEDGGPQDIVGHCRNGLLIDPLNVEGMGQALLEALCDRERWRRRSRSGLAGARRHYSWPGHANKYMRIVKKVVTQQGKRQVRQEMSRRIVTADRAVVCDIDNTLIGDRNGLRELLQVLDGAGDSVLFAVATGRSIDLTLKVLKEWKIPTPGLLITSVGTEIHYGPRLVEDMGWKGHINYRWRPNRIRKLMKRLPGIKLQPPEGQREYKISFVVDTKKAPPVRSIGQRLRKAGLSANVVFSHQAYLDILPIRASKGTAVRYCAMKWDIPTERIVVAGDSGNDEEMLAGNTLGVVVGNHDGELDKLLGRPQIYFAEGYHAWGIIEGLEHYDFFGELKSAEVEVPTYEKVAV